VDSIRVFSADTQRTISRLDEVVLLPATRPEGVGAGVGGGREEAQCLMRLVIFAYNNGIDYESDLFISCDFS
jgi:hypothetical protein